MPYARAPYYMLAVIGVILIGFWPSYFAVGRASPWQFHAHGIAASLWVLMVAAQSWTAHRKVQLPIHRAIGMASLFLFPFLIAGLAAIITIQAKNWIEGEPLHLFYGPGFMIGTMVAMAAYVTVYYRAIKYRRKVWVHAGYMLSTPLILFESPFSRAAAFVFPPFMVKGPADFPHVMASIEWSCAIELAIIAIIWWRVGEKARPFLVTAGFIVVEMLAMGFATKVEALKQFDTFIGHVPAMAIVLTGFAIGAATSWAGWQAGKRPAVPVAGAAVQPA
ncbi:MAG: hypothetical protein V4502_09545 [Pseudomonadota bacterium]